ncbi:hypothetical protein [Cedecea sp. P7760]|uniref:hypothetical protein n=1 Tax=Cedecea sp. P7760 TaxID=2726983 RepID=UPI0015A455E1|nr:hypothetical protein [Cedecea sp. P7760]NWC65425.1 hypothetical protein [Cedecea sp. P7760]
MPTEQRTINHRGANTQVPVLNIELHVAPDFSGRVVIHFEKGRAICHRRLLDREHVASLDSFLELARMAGYRVSEGN